MVLAGIGLIHLRRVPTRLQDGVQQPGHFSVVPSAEGLSITGYDRKGQPSCLLKVGTCRLREKKADLFGIASVKMAEMSNVEVEMGTRPDHSTVDRDFAGGGPSEVVDLFKEIPRFLRWNNIEYFEIHGIKVTIHDPAGAVATIQAARMSPLPRGQFILAGGVVLTDGVGARQLTTDQVVWWPNLGVYAVTGPYSLRRPGQDQRAMHTLFDTQLEPITDKKEIRHYEQLASAATFHNDTK